MQVFFLIKGKYLVWKITILKYFSLQQVRKEMEKQVAQKSTELEQYLQRVREMEGMYRQLEDALEDEKRARQEEEAVRKLQARWVCEGWRRRRRRGGGGGRRHLQTRCVYKGWRRSTDS